MSETCENCGNSAMPPRGWENDWSCAECGHTQGDPISNSGVWENLSEGDLIQWDGGTKNPHKVTTPEPAGNIRGIEGPGGASKMMVQNKNDPDSISVMSMGDMNDSGTWIQNLRVVGHED